MRLRLPPPAPVPINTVLWLQLLLPRYADLLPGSADVLLDMQPSSSTSSSTTRTSTSSTTPVAPKGLKGKYGLPPPGPIASQATTSSPSTAPTTSWGRMQTLVRAQLPTAQAQSPAVSGPVGSPSEPASSPTPPALSLSGPRRLAMSFRAYKQMVLWDLVLRSGVPPGQLARFVGVGGGEDGGAV